MGLNDGSSVPPVENNTLVSYNFLFLKYKFLSSSKYYFYVLAQ